jgi:glyceraldehyde-3-phosphate dehydrogenase/erythrose-4-phosphate dehydrogenase
MSRVAINGLRRIGVTQVVDDLVRIMSCHDNEWGYASPMIQETETIAAGGR